MLQDTALQQIESLVPLVDWNKALMVWSMFVDFPHSVTVSKPVTATTTEGCGCVEFPEKSLLASSKELNMVYSAIKSDSVDCKKYTETFCAYNSKYTNMENCLQDIETLCYDEGCTVNEGVLSHLKNGTKKCTDDSDNDVLVEHDNVGDEPEEVSAIAADKHEPLKETCLPSFRATCYRTGSHHCFQSPSAAAHFGGALQDYFGWKVDLNNHDIEVVLSIEDTNIRIGITLTNRSLHRRHITHFGRTTLRPTIAHGMLRYVCTIMGSCTALCSKIVL